MRSARALTSSPARCAAGSWWTSMPYDGFNFPLGSLERAAAIVYRTLTPTPQFAWPLLAKELGAEVWVKHENFTPTGAFKVRGGLVYFEELCAGKRPAGVISATRGNHGQSVGYAARKHGIPATI